MNKSYLLGILFFSALWGVSESALGGAFYRANIFHASIPLTIIAFMILSIARAYLPQKGSATLIAFVAMFYKFMNAPFFACHLLAIFLLGVSYDLCFSFFNRRSNLCDYSSVDAALRAQAPSLCSIAGIKGETFRLSEKWDYHALRNSALFGLVSTYIGYTLFALTITYVFRYHYWIAEGLPRILRYVGIGGTMAAVGNALFVPVSLRLGRMLREKAVNPFFEFKPTFAAVSISLITACLWILGVTQCF